MSESYMVMSRNLWANLIEIFLDPSMMHVLEAILALGKHHTIFERYSRGAREDISYKVFALAPQCVQSCGARETERHIRY